MGQLLFISFITHCETSVSQTLNDTNRIAVPRAVSLTNENLSITGERDTLSKEIKNNVHIQKPAFSKKIIQSVAPHGKISAGYEYGVLPFSSENKFPVGGFTSEGSISFNLVTLPLELTYYYTSIKNTIGLNNYFRISYDSQKYKDQLLNTASGKEQDLKGQLGKLKIQQQQVAQKIGFLNYLQLHPDYKSPVQKNDHFNTDSTLKIPDTAGLYKQPVIPVTNYSSAIPDTSYHHYKVPSYTGDSASAYSYKADSISGELKKYTSQYDSLSGEMNSIREDLNAVHQYQKRSDLINNPYLSKVQQVLSHIKKLEIGLCHPSSSTFLVNNIPLQGINLEYVSKKHFFSVAYGTTTNNYMYNPHTLDGVVKGSRNYYNYFDFGNLEAGRKIIMLKGGIGEKEENHFYAGVLVGKGKSDYLLPDHDPSFYAKESNVVLELDAKYKFSANLSTELVIGKSSVKEEDLSMDQVKSAVNEIFSLYRSYAAQSRTKWSIKKTRTNFTFTSRWIDPYFKSFGLGFLRSDNFRYELKAEQALGNKIKYTVAFKKEEDNLLRLYDYKTTFYSLSNSLAVKINRQINIRLMYSPLYRTFRYENTVTRNQNNISTGVISWTPGSKKVQSQFSLLYSRYVINGDSSNLNFENFSYSNQFKFKSGFKIILNTSWFRNNLIDTIGNNIYLGSLEVGYSAKNNNSFMIGGKAAGRKTSDVQYGFIAEALVKIYRQLYFEMQAERIIIGDYYNSFDVNQIKKFPYYTKAQLILNF